MKSIIQAQDEILGTVSQAYERAIEKALIEQKLTPDHAKGLTERLGRAYNIVLSGWVTELKPGYYIVQGSEPPTTYEVNGRCTCPDFSNAPAGMCKHRIAAKLFRKRGEQVQALFPHEHVFACDHRQACYDNACVSTPQGATQVVAARGIVELGCCPACKAIFQGQEAIDREAMLATMETQFTQTTQVPEDLAELLTNPLEAASPLEVTAATDPQPVVEVEPLAPPYDTPTRKRDKKGRFTKTINALKAAVNGHVDPVEPEPVCQPQQATIEVLPPLIVRDEYEARPLLPAPAPAPLPEAPVSLCLTWKLPFNGQLTYTMRGITDADVLARVPAALAELERVLTPVEEKPLGWMARIVNLFANRQTV